MHRTLGAPVGTVKEKESDDHRRTLHKVRGKEKIDPNFDSDIRTASAGTQHANKDQITIYWKNVTARTRQADLNNCDCKNDCSKEDCCATCCPSEDMQKKKNKELMGGNKGLPRNRGVKCCDCCRTADNCCTATGGCECDCEKSNEPKGPKTILNKVSGFARPKELLAIMGSSGGGKTTLLNILTFRHMHGLEIDKAAEITANGIPLSPEILMATCGYVQQEDLFVGSLTVKEHLIFQSKVRMDRRLSASEKKARVKHVIEDLNLSKCRNTIIGVPGKIKGISGGERKRLAFASEVLTNPRILLCDEPTSGLDAFMAEQVVKVLSILSRRGICVICTIHQPSSQIFQYIDRLYLMADGRVAYFGGREECFDFVASVGFPCPDNYNPCDHYINLISKSPTEPEGDIKRIKIIRRAYEKSKIAAEAAEVLENSKRLPTYTAPGLNAKKGHLYRTNFCEQLGALLWRNSIASVRDPILIQVHTIQTVLVAFLLGLLFFDQKYTQSGVRNITGAIFICLIHISFHNMYAVVDMFCAEFPILLREHYNGMYRVEAYYIARQVADLPFFVILPVVFTTIFYWLVGLNPEWDRFLAANVIILLVTQVSTSFGYMISCLSPSLQVALAFAPSISVPFLIFGGFFIDAESAPGWLSWIQYVSWYKFGNEALTINQWKGVTGIKCDNNANDIPCITKGDYIIDANNFDPDMYYWDLVSLGVASGIFRVLGLGFLVLRTKLNR